MSSRHQPLRSFQMVSSSDIAPNMQKFRQHFHLMGFAVAKGKQDVLHCFCCYRLMALRCCYRTSPLHQGHVSLHGL